MVNFYKDTCPKAEELVREEMLAIQNEDPTLMPALFRLHFHDCFVRGCDASVLLNSLNGTAEKDAPLTKAANGRDGAHTFGVAHCTSFSDRLYNFTGKRDQDPSLNSTYAEKLKQKCLTGDNTTVVEMDPGNLLTFNTSYFTGVMNNQGLFVADAALLNNRTTRAYVEAIYRENSPKPFFLDFALSMIHMGRIKPLIGTNGTIRAVCGSFVN
ncbi:hypothetical protein LUZ63_015808 [Rhynchospora breviuscula]|uniref:Plant heme peroxidase family profile domain-containing protein n=1 Tax=Rhynchospora breviuscula TaxID=2022672 RepID=A0A9Q0CD20_9POAL|nr:hypothetical protein LUZ63_015808 [Rhynchospora breviuscula]